MSVEYSAGLEADQVQGLCRVLHAAMVDAGIFPLAGIRVRAHRADFAIIADGLAENDFVAMTLSVGAGRSTETLKAAGDAIFEAARTALAARLESPHFALSMEIRVSDPALSWKDTPIHARLTGKG